MATDLLGVLQQPPDIAGLQGLDLRDTLAEPQFERLTRLATTTLNVPVSIISFVDGGRLYLKSVVGFPATWSIEREMPLSQSLCQYVVASNQPLIVHDVRQDRRLRRSRLVSDLRIAAYAGVPLALDEDHVLGSFCLIDHRPRVWSDRQLAVLYDLAQVALDEIRLRVSNQALQRQEEERAAREEQLRLYREIIANSSEAIGIVDQSGHYLEQNGAHSALTGYSDDELRGKTPAIHLGEDSFQQIIHSLAATGYYRGEVTSKARSGELREIELASFSVRDQAGEPVCYVGIKRDITDRKRAEETLRRRFDQLRTIYHMADTITRAGAAEEIFEAAVVGLQRALKTDRAAVLLFDPDGVPRFKAWRGLSETYRQAVEGHSPWAQSDPDPQPILLSDAESEPTLAPYRQVIAAEGIRAMAFIPLVYHNKLLGKLMLYYNTPHHFGEEEIQVARTMASHIAFANERRRDQEAQRFLIEASTLLVSLLDYEQTLSSIAQLAVPRLADWCAIDIINEDGQLHQMAVAHVDATKVELARELRRRYPPDPDEPHAVWSVVRSSRAELAPEITTAQLARRARDAEHLSLLQSLGIKSHMVVPLIARGRTLGVISFVSGLSGRNYSESDLALAEELARRAAFAVDNARLYADAQRALKTRDQFLSISAHELKTPITALLGYAQLLQRRAERDAAAGPRDQQILGALIDQSRRLYRLSVSLLELSRIQLGAFTIERAQVDICALVRKVTNELQLTTEQHSLVFDGLDAPLPVEGDALRLEQVLMNLLHNAIKYSPRGGPVITRVERFGDRICISITDCGIGIPREAQAMLFDRYYRAGNVDPQQISGMGLGLYVVKEIVRLHGGSVEVKSKEGQGSTFTVFLPCTNVDGTPSAYVSTADGRLASRQDVSGGLQGGDDAGT